MAIIGNTVILGYGDVGFIIDFFPKNQLAKMVLSNLTSPLLTDQRDQNISDDDFDKDSTQISIVFDHESAKKLVKALQTSIEYFEQNEAALSLQIEKS